MTSYKLANYIALRNSVTRDKYLPRLLISNRHFCSKDDKTKTENSSSEDQLPKEKKQKQKELEQKESLEVEASSPETADSDANTKSAAKEKLMALLSGIKITADKPTKTSSNLNLAKPLKRVSKRERLREMEEKVITPEKEMDMAVKAVAGSFKEDPEKIESELATKLSSINLTAKPMPEEEAEDIADDYNSELNNEMNKKLMSSVEEVADAISESPIPARSELTKRLMRLSIDQKLASEKKSMKSVVQSMAIQSTKPVPALKKEVVKKTPVMKKIGRINLFGSRPLNIFTPGAETKTGTTNDLWRKLEEREVRLLTQFGPANAFEEMIMWTEQGKHWKFPIDNQIEMEEEKYGFHEHVFLEHHLKGFPTKGPIRHFMELVVVGLSKNPYITVDRKLDHIEWFRTYFKDKEDILREEGAIE